MKRIAYMLSLVLLIVMVLPVNTASAMPRSNQKAGIQVSVPEYRAAQAPGGYVTVQVGIYNAEFADSKGLRSADIIISYDEDVFEVPNDLLRYDEANERYVWHDNAYSKNTQWSDAKDGWVGSIEFEDFTLTAPYPMDLDPDDGRQEIRFKAEITGNHHFSTKTLDPENFLSLDLKVKENAPLKKTAITVVTNQSVLKDSTNSTVKTFYYKAAHLSIEKPSSISIIEGFSFPSDKPLAFHKDVLTILQTRTNFSNGDFDIVTNGTFSSSDPSIVKLSQDGTLMTNKATGSAWITVTLGELTAKKRVDVVEDSVVIPLEQQQGYGFMYFDPYRDDQQIFINGEDAGLGRLIDGSIYAPLKKIGTILHGNVAYDEVNKVPTLNDKAVNHFKTFGRTTYIKLADLRSLVGATLTWNKQDGIVSISVKKVD